MHCRVIDGMRGEVLLVLGLHAKVRPVLNVAFIFTCAESNRNEKNLLFSLTSAHVKSDV